ncbi:hypothetical protein [Pontibacillus yanchengensis]|uniref:Uncharacterized protein n=1 Tax=Pontibacillus yanchengensis Y32 TaxID=1385514 RepID=A0A0A2TFH1_9BACI|nr:hypothetical protein [Pontibacillus yanchengensis]KGP74597.1 hypothetical protein N782_00635 [Pontibacillus yanchengensis Y32]
MLDYNFDIIISTTLETRDLSLRLTYRGENKIKHYNQFTKGKKKNRKGRLAKAQEFIDKYKGKELYKGYAKHFSIDKLVAIRDLEQLGYEFSEEFKEEMVAKHERIVQHRKRKKEEKKQRKQRGEEEALFDSDENFAFIAGYTSGGFPFGVPWDDWDEPHLEVDEEFKRKQLNDYEEAFSEQSVVYVEQLNQQELQEQNIMLVDEDALDQANFSKGVQKEEALEEVFEQLIQWRAGNKSSDEMMDSLVHFTDRLFIE